MSPMPAHETMPAGTHTTTAAQDTAPSAPTPSPSSTKKRKRKEKDTVHILHQSTFRHTPWSYFHLELLTPSALPSRTPPPPPSSSTSHVPAAHPSTPIADVSPLLVSTLLTAPLHAYLGLTGAAVPFDILKISGRSVWVRVPRRDARAVRASVSSWVGSCEAGDVPGAQGEGTRVKVAWRVVGEAGALMGVVCGDGSELFG